VLQRIHHAGNAFDDEKYDQDEGERNRAAARAHQQNKTGADAEHG